MLSAIIVAAGSSRRTGFDKLFAVVASKSVLAHSIAAFEHAHSVTEIILVGREDRQRELEQIIASENFRKVRAIVVGGERRQDSVQAGLAKLGHNGRYIAVHDAARPLITPQQIERVYGVCRAHGAAASAEPVTDTLKYADVDLAVTGSVDRQQLFAMQTPQIFESELLRNAYAAVFEQKILITDEVSAVERVGGKVFLVPNEDINFKITYPQDLPLAEFALKQRLEQGSIQNS
jgi:2-C-methyl-D-erythritol 4-phosphate cytidylyltransferase